MLRVHALIIFLTSVLFIAPVLLLGPGGVDLHCQAIWFKLFTQQFWHGDLYPRWLQDMFAGDGAPVFFYYPPIPYYITAFFVFLSSADLFGYASMVMSLWLSIFISGITFYFWMKEETGNGDAALLSSLLYVTVPDHIAQDFYNLLVPGSLWAYTWVPLLFLFAKRLAQKKPYSLIGFACALALLVMTNLPNTLIFAPAALLYGALHFYKGQWLMQSISMVIATAFGFALSAVYLLPALLYKPFVIMDSLWTDYGAPGKSTDFYFIGWDSAYAKLFMLGWLAAALLTCLYFKATPKTPKRIFFFVLSCGALFLMTPLSQPVWDTVSVLHLLQYSCRLLTVPALVVSCFAAFAFPRLRKLSYGLLLLFAVVTLGFAINTRTSPEAMHQKDALRYEHFLMNIDQRPTFLTSPNLITLYDREGTEALKARHTQIDVLSGDAAVEIKQWRSRSVLLHYSAHHPSVLRIRQFYFPGHQASMGNKELDIRRDEHTGEIIIDVPKGSGDVDIQLTALLPEMVGKFLSVCAAAILLLLTLIEVRRKSTIAPQ